MPFTYAEFAPGARVAPYVECYWSLQVDSDSPSHRVLPDGCVDILFSKRGAEPAALNLVGLMTAPVIASVQRGECFFGVRFRPGMASAMIPEAAALTDKVEPLESFWGSRANELLNRFGECGSVQDTIQIIERQLRPLEPGGALDRALNQLSTGKPALNDLAEKHGMSARHFRRNCQLRSGVPPKLLSRIIRFRRVVQRIGRLTSLREQANWAHFAAACGYYDQAHFIREFQAFSGVTPGQYLQSAGLNPPIESICEPKQA